jgi:hypothetical protein
MKAETGIPAASPSDAGCTWPMAGDDASSDLLGMSEKRGFAVKILNRLNRCDHWPTTDGVDICVSPSMTRSPPGERCANLLLAGLGFRYAQGVAHSLSRTQAPEHQNRIGTNSGHRLAPMDLLLSNGLPIQAPTHVPAKEG